MFESAPERTKSVLEMHSKFWLFLLLP